MIVMGTTLLFALVAVLVILARGTARSVEREDRFDDRWGM